MPISIKQTLYGYIVFAAVFFNPHETELISELENPHDEQSLLERVLQVLDPGQDLVTKEEFDTLDEAARIWVLAASTAWVNYQPIPVPDKTTPFVAKPLARLN